MTSIYFSMEYGIRILCIFSENFKNLKHEFLIRILSTNIFLKIIILLSFEFRIKRFKHDSFLAVMNNINLKKKKNEKFRIEQKLSHVTNHPGTHCTL